MSDSGDGAAAKEARRRRYVEARRHVEEVLADAPMRRELLRDWRDFVETARMKVPCGGGAIGHTARVVPALLHPAAAAFAGSVVVEVTDGAAKSFMRQRNFAKTEGSEAELAWRAKAYRALAALPEVVGGVPRFFECCAQRVAHGRPYVVWEAPGGWVALNVRGVLIFWDTDVPTSLKEADVASWN